MVLVGAVKVEPECLCLAAVVLAVPVCLCLAVAVVLPIGPIS